MSLRAVLGRLTRQRPPSADRRYGTPPVAERLWEQVVPGSMMVGVWIDPSTESVYVSDGWGVTYSSLRFHRLDLATGAETASIRTGTTIRCFTFDSTGDIIGATDSKVFRLDPRTLKERKRWDTRIPRYTSTMALVGDQLVAANSIDPKVSFVDLTTGKVRRCPAPAQPWILSRNDTVLIVGGSEAGGVVRVDAVAGTVTRVADTPPALGAWLSAHTGDLWLLAGVRMHVDAMSVERGAASASLVRCPAPDYRPAPPFALPHKADALDGEQASLWLTGDRQYRGDRYLEVVPLPLVQGVAREWKPPKGEDLIGLEPATSMVITGRRVKGKEATTLTCYRLDLDAA